MDSYLDAYKSPIGILLITWTVVYLALAGYVVFIRNEEFSTALLLGSGLVFALIITFVLTRER